MEPALSRLQTANSLSGEKFQFRSRGLDLIRFPALRSFHHEQCTRKIYPPPSRQNLLRFSESGCSLTTSVKIFSWCLRSGLLSTVAARARQTALCCSSRMFTSIPANRSTRRIQDDLVLAMITRFSRDFQVQKWTRICRAPLGSVKPNH